MVDHFKIVIILPKLQTSVIGSSFENKINRNSIYFLQFVNFAHLAARFNFEDGGKRKEMFAVLSPALVSLLKLAAW